MFSVHLDGISEKSGLKGAMFSLPTHHIQMSGQWSKVSHYGALSTPLVSIRLKQINLVSWSSIQTFLALYTAALKRALQDVMQEGHIQRQTDKRRATDQAAVLDAL